jgi:Uma2 family endonuclease
MDAISSTKLISVADYLAGELTSQSKHEYLGGVIYAMAGARNVHNRIAGNIFGSLHAQMRGKPCQPYNSDTKIRIQSATHVRFYYPDVSVVCQSNSPDDSFQDQPVVVVEVLSRKTRRTDEGEKKDAYLTVPSLAVYLLVEQEAAVVTAHRRTERGFVREVYEGIDAKIPLAEIDTKLTLADIFEGVEFTPEPHSED